MVIRNRIVPVVCSLFLLSLLSACSDSGFSDPPVDPYMDTFIGASGVVESSFFCRPDTKGNGQLLIHLVGSFVDASIDSSTGFARHACTHGFAALVPAYDNRNPARIVCGEHDLCHEDFHREILFGVEGAPEPVNVGYADSIVGIVTDLLHDLAEHDPGYDWDSLATKFEAGSLQSATVSGHSQGNGHALFWAREEVFRRVILLGGVADRLGPTAAEDDRVTWLKEMAGKSSTPIERIKSFYHLDEDGLTGIIGSRANLTRIGVSPFCDYFNLESRCSAIEIPEMGCVNPVAAHGVVLYETFSESCNPEGSLSNAKAWDLLLLDGASPR
jgi:hypothetical protein